MATVRYITLVEQWGWVETTPPRQYNVLHVPDTDRTVVVWLLHHDGTRQCFAVGRYDRHQQMWYDTDNRPLTLWRVLQWCDIPFPSRIVHV